ncbi:MAG: 30S ribosomal protein S4 [Minisyncoccia bacterium]
MNDPLCKRCRTIGEKLFLKGEKCYTPKCPLVRKGVALHGKNKKRAYNTPYGRQLAEKQKAKLIYGLRERQFHRYFEIAKQKKGSTPEILAKILETRFDNIIYRAGFALNRHDAKQLITHGFFYLNGRKHNIPSTLLKQNDIITINPNDLNKEPIKRIREFLKKNKPPKFITVDPEKLEIKVIGEPDLTELKTNTNIDFSAIVEFYSK